MAYPEALKYLESFINYEKIPAYPYKESLKLEPVKNFLTVIGNPQNALRCIHVAGTKGKGSTCAFLAYILREAGYKVGLYTSPHLSDFRERIRILNPVGWSTGQRVSWSDPPTRRPADPPTDFEGMISRNELAGLVKKLKPFIDKYNRQSKYGPLTFFEVYTALAFVYFKEKKTDFVVLETGLGGRLDATNTVNSLVSIITPISYEHTDKLGKTLTQIATEKAGIIKERSALCALRSAPPVISAPQENQVRKVIRNKCKETGARLYEVGREVKIRNFKIRLLGKHQLINANVASAAIKALGVYNIKISNSVIRKGIYNTIWPGRCEVVAKNPFVVLDGAQNAASAEALRKAARDNFKYKKLILILGVSNDKDIKGITNVLSDLADVVILTKADHPRALEPDVIAGHIKHKEAYITKSVKEARAISQSIAGYDDLILVTGSLFVVGEFKRCTGTI